MKSIRRQLTWTFLTGFGLVLLCGGLAVYFFTRLALFDALDNSLRAKAVAIVSMADNDEGELHLEIPDSLSKSGGSAVPQFYEIWRGNGTVCARSAALNNGDLPLRHGTFGQPEFWDVELPGDEDGRAIGCSFSLKTEAEESRKQASADFIVVVAADCRAVNETLTTLAIVLGVTGLAALAVTVPLVRSALRRGHAPLDRLAAQAAAINADSLQARFSAETMPGELQPIAGRLNDLLARLESSFVRERRFSADLAHELRTPLTELRSLAEVELAWPESGETEKYRDVLSIAVRMETMVGRLLELARSEHGGLPVCQEPVQLAALVPDVWRPFASRAEARHLAMQIAVPTDAVWEADPVLLRSILANLLANAVEYSPAGGQCGIRWDAARGELAIANPVQDLTDGDIPHLFERLWRKDPSRTDGGHCGLGLALSRALAARLELELQARLDDDRVLTMTLRRRAD